MSCVTLLESRDVCHSVLPFCDLYHIWGGWVFVVSGSVMACLFMLRIGGEML